MVDRSTKKIIVVMSSMNFSSCEIKFYVIQFIYISAVTPFIRSLLGAKVNLVVLAHVSSMLETVRVAHVVMPLIHVQCTYAGKEGKLIEPYIPYKANQAILRSTFAMAWS